MVAETILITGANRGIGLGLVKELLRCPEPPQVLIASYRDPDKAEELLNLAEENSNLTAIQFDVKDRSSLPEVSKKVEELVGEKGLNLLINNAGIMYRESLPDVDFDNMMESYEVNTVSPLLLVHELHPVIKKASEQAEDKPLAVSRAAIINISSILGSITLFPENTSFGGPLYSYTCSKAAQNMMTRSLSCDLGKDGILCVCLHPGWVATASGGPDAPTSVEDCCSAILATLSSLDDSHQGAFIQYDGKSLPW